jgi:hypothetical protein
MRDLVHCHSSVSRLLHVRCFSSLPPWTLNPKPGTPLKKQQNSPVAADPVKSICFAVRASGYDEELVETAICCFRRFITACSTGNSIGVILIRFVVSENSFLPSFSFALIVERRTIVLGPFSSQGLPTDVVVTDFLVFFYAAFDAEFGSQGICVYEASFVLFV